MLVSAPPEMCANGAHLKACEVVLCACYPAAVGCYPINLTYIVLVYTIL